MREKVCGIALLSVIALACGQANTPPVVDQVVVEIPRASGVIELDGMSHPYLLEGRGIPCVVAAL